MSLSVSRARRNSPATTDCGVNSDRLPTLWNRPRHAWVPPLRTKSTPVPGNRLHRDAVPKSVELLPPVVLLPPQPGQLL
jgi:hypothetical protein